MRTKSEATRQRIIETAWSLFYRQGYNATGITQIIEEAGITRPTLYNYFDSKETLCVAYIEERHRQEHSGLQAAIDGIKDPKKQFVAIMKAVRDRMVSTQLRGCGFMNIATEIPDPDSPIRKAAQAFNDSLMHLIAEVTRAAKASDPALKDLNVSRTVQTYMVILSGGIITAAEYNDAWPLDRAVDQVKALLTP
jgi:AcrR family transcriptional regulator